MAASTIIMMTENYKKFNKIFTVLLRFVGTFAAFLMHFIVAIKLGASDAGVFYIVFAISSIASTISRLGLDYAVTKFVSEYGSSNKAELVSYIYSFSVKAIILTSIPITGLLLLANNILAIYVFKSPEMVPVLYVMTLGILPYSLLIMTAHAFQGSGEIVLAIFYQVILHPLLMSVLFLTVFSEQGVKGAALAFALSALICFVAVSFVWFRKNTVRALKGDITKTSILLVSIPILVSFLAQQALQHTPILLLGIFATSEQTGVYSVVHRLASVVSIAVIAANFIVAPKAASYFSLNEISKLQRVAHRGSEVSLVVGMPILLFLLFFSPFILSLFGDEYIVGKLALVILLIGQVSNLLNGSGSVLLMMTAGQNKFMQINIVGFIVCLVLSLVLIPIYESTAAAISVSIALCLINIRRYYAAKNIVGVSSLPRIPGLF